MKQVIQNVSSGRLTVAEVPPPSVRPNYLLVQTIASVISPGTERMVIDFAKKSMAGKAVARPDLVRKVLEKARREGLSATLRSVRSRLDEPLPLGYSASGRIVAVGAGLEGKFSVGQRVAMAGAGVANHAELNLVPETLAAPVLDGIDDELAAFATIAAIALHGVRNLSLGLGETVAVIGVGLIGQLAIQILALAGMRPIAVDVDEERLRLARRMGAELSIDAVNSAAAAIVSGFTEGRGVDAVLIAAAGDSNGPLELAATIARDRARISVVGKVGTEFPFGDYMKKELSLIVSRSYGPGRYDDDFEQRGIKYPVGFVRWTETENLVECLRLMARPKGGRLDISPLITHRLPIERAEDAYGLILEHREPHLGVVLTYANQPVDAAVEKVARSDPKEGRALGLIGAGSFARSVLLPALTAVPGVALATVVASRGATAEAVRQKFGFATAGTDTASIFDNPNIHMAMIATPHATHASLTAQALRADKHVFVEKPLALDRTQLEEVMAAHQASGRLLTVGFNRRFAPLAVKLAERLAALSGPKILTMRVNAGPAPTQGWLADARQGGRILGEACHFVDLARYLVGSPIRRVGAAAAQSGASVDNVAVTLEFTDGSLSSIVYTGLGDSAFPKEYIEAFCAGTAAVIDDWRSLTITTAGRTTRHGARLGQDKGHFALVKAFIRAVSQNDPAPIPETELYELSLATIAILESLQQGRPIEI